MIVNDELCFTPAVELAARIRRREISPLEVVQSSIERAGALESRLHGFITRTDELALNAARAAEATLMQDGPDALGPLAGLPISIKDNTKTEGVRTTFGATEYLDHIPDHNAPVASRVLGAGASLLGKNAGPPFGWLGVTTNDISGTTCNPWNLSRTVGGSSGGAGALVAAGVGSFATGSDGGGSIRVPASLCGIVGLKPSHGRVPRGDESPLFETVDALGPMARTVADAALLLSVMAGPIEGEPYMLPEEGVDYVADLRAGTIDGWRVAFSPDMGYGPVDPEVASIVADAVRHFGSALRCSVDQVELDVADPVEFFTRNYPPMIYSWTKSEPAAVALIARYPRLRDLVEGEAATLAHDWWDYVGAARERTFRGISKIFGTHDVLITPTMPVAAWPHDDECGPRSIAGLPVTHPNLDFFRFTEPAGHSGHPAITVNCGFTRDGLPVGLQIIGRQRDDRAVLRAAAAYEATTEWLARRPSI